MFSSLSMQKKKLKKKMFSFVLCNIICSSLWFSLSLHCWIPGSVEMGMG